MHLAVGITRNAALTELDLLRNFITDEGASAMAAVMPRNRTLRAVNIAFGNQVSKQFLHSIGGRGRDN